MEQLDEPKEFSGALSILNTFVSNMHDLIKFDFDLLPIAAEQDKKSAELYENIKKIIKNVPKELKKGGTSTIEEAKVDKTASDIVSLIRRRTPVRYAGPKRKQSEILMKTSFVMCISYFDYLVSDIIHWHYTIHPEALSGKEYITLSELKQCNDRDEAIELIMNKKADSILFGRLDSQISIFKNEIKIDLNETIVDWDMINEAVEKRNLVVHNNGYVNRRYINNTKGYICGDNAEIIKEGQIVSIDSEYYFKIYSEIYVAGFLLLESCWRKWVKEERSKADLNLMYEMEKATLRPCWDIAEKIGKYAKNIGRDQKRREKRDQYFIL